MSDNIKDFEAPMYLSDLSADEFAFIMMYRHASPEEQREIDRLIDSYSSNQE